MTLDGKWTEILGQNVDWLVRKWKLFSSSMSSIQYSLITNWNSVRDLSWHKGLGCSSLWSHRVASGKVVTVRELLWKARKELRGSQGKIWSCLSRIVLAGGTAMHWLLTHEVDLFHWRKFQLPSVYCMSLTPDIYRDICLVSNWDKILILIRHRIE